MLTILNLKWHLLCAWCVLVIIVVHAQNSRHYFVAFFLESTCKLIAWKRENMSSFFAPFMLLLDWLNSKNPFNAATQPLCLRSTRKVLTFNYCSTFLRCKKLFWIRTKSTRTYIYSTHLFPSRQKTIQTMNGSETNISFNGLYKSVENVPTWLKASETERQSN